MGSKENRKLELAPTIASLQRRGHYVLYQRPRQWYPRPTPLTTDNVEAGLKLRARPD